MFLNRYKCLTFCLLVLFTTNVSVFVQCKQPKKVVNIAVFLDPNEDVIATEKVLQKTVSLINKNLTKYVVLAEVFKLNDKQIFEAGDKLCTKLQQGLAAIVGQGSTEINKLIQTISKNFKIPQFLTYSNLNLVEGNHLSSDIFTFNLHPSLEDLSKCFATILMQNDWSTYTILYENDDALIRLKDALKEIRPVDPKVSFRKLGDGPDYRTVLKEVKKSKETRIILDCKTENLIPILNQAKEIKLLEEYHNYMLTNLDSYAIDWSGFYDVTTNITGIKLLDDIPRDWYNIRSRPISTSAALLHDALLLFNKILSKIDPSELNVSPLFCEDPEISEHAGLITNFIGKETNSTNATALFLSGPLRFDRWGRRSRYTMHVTEFNKSDVTFGVTSTWDPRNPDRISFKRTEMERQQLYQKSIQERTFKVVSRLGAPYLMLRKFPGFGNARFEGYALDLMEEICKILNCTYTFELVPDGQYGQYNPQTKEWDGLIRHLLDRKADLAVCDLTISYERRTAVDFSLPFMTLGISILYSKTAKEPPPFLAFTAPLSLDIWLYMATSYLIISLLIFLAARLNPNDWENPHPCESCPEELENIWNVKNCCWLTIGSIMAQGCDLLPKGISTRMVTSMWWFFSLIMTACYTANLAAFLTMERMGPTIESAEDLASQNKIKYGCLSGGSTFSFFKETNFSTYHRMWVQMEGADPTVFETSNADGVKRILTNKNKYAFIMESTNIEYQTERNCDLRQVGNQLDSKGYGIAMPKEFQYRKSLNEAILKMQESGILRTLKNKWWVEMNDGGKCKGDEHGDSDAATELGLDHVGGVFAVLVAGIGIALAFAMCEFLWHVRKVAVKEHMTFKEAFHKEMKFAINIWARQKAVTKESTPSASARSRSIENVNGKK